jgi:hypothetical protein
MADLEPFPELIEGRRLDPKSWTETAPASPAMSRTCGHPAEVDPGLASVGRPFEPV